MKVIHNGINEGAQLRRYKKATVILAILLALSLAYADFTSRQLKDLQKTVLICDRENKGLHTVKFSYLDTMVVSDMDDRKYREFCDSVLNR